MISAELINTSYHTQALALHNKASADPLRLNILRILAEGSFGVLELCQLFAIKQSSMSHHLKILAKAKLVTTRREGNSIFYRRALLSASSDWSALRKALFETLATLTIDADTQQALDVLYNERAANAREFFSKHADDFKEQQDLIASHEQYGETLQDLIAKLDLAHNTVALEIGPGEGALLPSLAKRFDRVIGLDVSEAMLAKATQTVSTHQLGNITLMAGDSAEAIKQGLAADFISCNMVLHHVPAPKDVFNDSARLLKPGGCLLITDLCAHNQAWAHESCGDLWLGFSPEELSTWALEADLREEQTQFLALRNGFQIQFRTFRRAVN